MLCIVWTHQLGWTFRVLAASYNSTSNCDSQQSTTIIRNLKRMILSIGEQQCPSFGVLNRRNVIVVVLWTMIYMPVCLKIRLHIPSTIIELYVSSCSLIFFIGMAFLEGNTVKTTCSDTPMYCMYISYIATPRRIEQWFISSCLFKWVFTFFWRLLYKCNDKYHVLFLGSLLLMKHCRLWVGFVNISGGPSWKPSEPGHKYV